MTILSVSILHFAIKQDLTTWEVKPPYPKDSMNRCIRDIRVITKNGKGDN